jgi:hypothetical protein
MTGRGRAGPTLAERTAARRADAVPAALPDEADEGRPCWVRVAAGDPPAALRRPGTVHAWRRAPDGGWEGLVVAWLPASGVSPRDPEAGASAPSR